VTATGSPAVYATPVFVCSCTASAADAVPAATVCGAVVKPSREGFQAAKDCQPGLKAAPARSPPHQDGAQASEPAIAAANRSRIASVCAAKSAGASAFRFFGAHAKPRRAPRYVRIAAACDET
jgi:hypothetical protein